MTFRYFNKAPLGQFYNSYSIAAQLTSPYLKDTVLSCPDQVDFKVLTRFVPEGQEDAIQLEVLIHPVREVIVFIWKTYEKTGVYVHIRYKRCLWTCKVVENKLTCLTFHLKDNSLYVDGKEVDRLVQWPEERVTTQKIFDILNKPSPKDLSTFMWLKKSSLVYLHNLGVNLYEQNKYGETVFHLAARLQDSKYFNHLASKLTDVNIRDNMGHTLLHCATKTGQRKTVKLLCDLGVKIDATNNKGETAMMFAVRHKSKAIELTKTLLQYSPNLDVQNHEVCINICLFNCSE